MHAQIAVTGEVHLEVAVSDLIAQNAPRDDALQETIFLYHLVCIENGPGAIGAGGGEKDVRHRRDREEETMIRHCWSLAYMVKVKNLKVIGIS
jgi:hypothetical protein